MRGLFADAYRDIAMAVMEMMMGIFQAIVCQLEKRATNEVVLFIAMMSKDVPAALFSGV